MPAASTAVRYEAARPPKEQILVVDAWGYTPPPPPDPAEDAADELIREAVAAAARHHVRHAVDHQHLARAQLVQDVAAVGHGRGGERKA